MNGGKALVEKIAHALYVHDMQAQGMSDGWAEDAWDDMGGSEHDGDRVQYELAAEVAVLPIIRKAERDAAREALDGLAEHIDQVASHFVGFSVGSQKAQDVRDYRDTHHPKEAR